MLTWSSCSNTKGVAVAAALLVAVAPITAAAAPQPSPTAGLPHSRSSTADLNAQGHSAAGSLSVLAWGFLPGELVRVREFARPGWQQLARADQRGRLLMSFTAGHRSGKDVLTFVGQGANSPGRTAGTVSVSVPRIAVYRFQ